jgi:hypothetical protein
MTAVQGSITDQDVAEFVRVYARPNGWRGAVGLYTSMLEVAWGLPHRGRISPEEAAYVREHLDEVQRLRTERGVPLLDPADPKTKERYGL